MWESNEQANQEIEADEQRQAYDTDRIREYISKNPDYVAVDILTDLDLDWDELTDEQKAIIWP